MHDQSADVGADFEDDEPGMLAGGAILNRMVRMLVRVQVVSDMK